MEKLTEKDLEKFLKELDKKELDDGRLNLLQFFNWCKTNGMVNRGKDDLSLCNNPECSSCRQLDKAFKNALKERSKDITLIKDGDKIGKIFVEGLDSNANVVKSSFINSSKEEKYLKDLKKFDNRSMFLDFCKYPNIKLIRVKKLSGENRYGLVGSLEENGYNNEPNNHHLYKLKGQVIMYKACKYRVIRIDTNMDLMYKGKLKDKFGLICVKIQ